ncbi:MarR family transcriptional regulator [Aminobacter sp. NyZ550]|jgi:MarR family transcriptional regulator for hemolysin|uniref:Transcriptional regulator n=2 Tax=Aminobacter TaxID=31988 RepID=A0AAC9AR23_AMIAI|nr:MULTISPECIES: MarR family transcriptional regulator [Aminobacter]AMS41278.1 transcriptional regulator [Aminobacter aminovorans]MBA8910030.1 MarR family transcriptional regulator for hemolysin [Aminobacter ciceronei]MBA9023776.1 MarR family transcriptional regulator for hemolysin [Aminobacter ciceronei]MBB3705737.1 MarR family transcriptional regulator for hemolysin [Aminobacter aminovorans]MRX36376.1 MarR family transcriptional regulator [Aminobacter sp. MDW-2]
MSNDASDRAGFGRSLLSVARLWRHAADSALDDCGLSHATAMPLLTLSRLGDNIRQGVIADHLGFEGPSLVRIVDLLAADGLITRSGDPGDRRAKILSLTDAGRSRVEEIELILERLRTELLADEDAAELKVALGVLVRLEQRLLAADPDS